MGGALRLVGLSMTDGKGGWGVTALADKSLGVRREGPSRCPLLLALVPAAVLIMILVSSCRLLPAPCAELEGL